MFCLTLCLTFLHSMNLAYSNSDVPCKMMPTDWVFIGANTEDFLLSSSQEPLQSVQTLAQTCSILLQISDKYRNHMLPLLNKETVSILFINNQDQHIPDV
jgi:hypothetical protein